jgi:molybdenum cofactor cytidylyltransferase
MRVGGILLTGGRSSRMGTPKALLSLKGEAFLVRVLRALESGGLDDIVIVTGAHDGEIRRAMADASLPASTRIVHNAGYACGQLSSLLTGLDALEPGRPDAVLVALVDQPSLRASTVAALVSAFEESRAPVVRPVWRGQRGHPVVFARDVFDALRSADLEAGARPVVHALGSRVREVDVDDPAIVEDIDTPEEYAHLRAETDPLRQPS